LEVWLCKISLLLGTSTDLFLLTNKIFTWRWPGPYNMYDAIQWSLSCELWGSMLLYAALFATGTFTSNWRRTIFVCFVLAGFVTADNYMSVPFLSGALLADFSISLEHYNPRRTLFKLAPFVLLVIALFLGSFPTSGADAAAWSRGLLTIFHSIFPADFCTHLTLAWL